MEKEKHLCGDCEKVVSCRGGNVYKPLPCMTKWEIINMNWSMAGSNKHVPAIRVVECNSFEKAKQRVKPKKKALRNILVLYDKEGKEVKRFATRNQMAKYLKIAPYKLSDCISRGKKIGNKGYIAEWIKIYEEDAKQ